MGCIAKTMQLVADNHKLVAPKMRNYTSEKRITSIRNYIDVNITNNVCAEDVCGAGIFKRKAVKPNIS